MQQVEFILSNLFIVHPDHSSNYKLRIVVNHQAAEESIQQSHQKYIFALALNETMLQHPYGCICLLEQSKRTGSYLQIGKGQLDFNEVLSSHTKDKATLNGVIYGTRAVNFDRIIAKYGYKIQRHRVEAAQQQKEMKFNRIRFKDHKLKEKLPVLRFKQAMIDRSNDINAKLLRLSNAVGIDGQEREKIDASLGENQKLSLTKKNEASKDSKNKANTNNNTKIKGQGSDSKKNLEEKHHYFYKIHEKIQSLLQLQDWMKLKWLQIKNIQLFKYRTLKEQQSQSKNTYDNDLILLSITHNFNKICEVVLKLIFNTNNRFIDLILPIPIALESLNFMISFRKYNTERLIGTTRVSSSVNKTVDLCNQEGEEKGFVSLEVLKENGLVVNMEKYRSQANDFATLSSQFPNTITKDISYSEIKSSQLHTLESRIRSNKPKIPNKVNNPLYNSLLPKNSRFSELRKDHLSVIQRIDSQLSTIKRIRKSFDNRNYLEQKSKFTLISPSSKSKDIQFLPNSLSLKIKNIYIHFYEERESNLSYLKFLMRNRKEVREVYSGFNNLQGQEGALILSDLQPQQSIHVRCQFQEKDSKVLGTCMIFVKDLIKSTGRQLKIFLSKGTSLCGYLIFEISLYRIKNNKVKLYKKSATVPSPQADSQEFQLQLTQNQINLQGYNKLPPTRPQFNRSFLIYQQQY